MRPDARAPGREAAPAVAAAAGRAGTLAISIVSHGQGEMVARLLDDLRGVVDGSVEVVVTLNRPEPEGFVAASPIPLTVLRNAAPLGFGANHNQALARSDAEFFLVMNPDVRLPAFDLAALRATMRDPAVAACAPLVVDPSGRIEDSARVFPAPLRILGRVARRLRGLPVAPDYTVAAGAAARVDWVAGMCVLFRASAFRAIGGFDTRYFMYLEDADICRRLWVAGYEVALTGATRIVHDARRATLKSGTHLRWHVASMARFFVRSLKLRAAGPARRASRAAPPP